MSPEIPLLPPEEDFLNLNDPNYPPTRVDPMSETECNDIIKRGWTQISPDQIDLPSRCAQWLIQGDIFTRRRSDLEDKFENPPTIVEIKRACRVAIVVIADESLPIDEVKFEPYDPNTHPEDIKVFNATPAEAVKLLEKVQPFSEAPFSNQKLQNTRKKGASRGIKNTAKI